MFLLLFTYVFGGAIGGSPKAYLMFALPGIMVQNALFTTLNTATGLSTDLKKGFFDRLRSLPIARFAPLAGRMLADLAKQAWALVMLLGVGLILGFRVGTRPLGVLAAFGLVLVVTLALSWAWCWSACWRPTRRRCRSSASWCCSRSRSSATRSSAPRRCRAGCRPSRRPIRCRSWPTRCAG